MAVQYVLDLSRNVKRGIRGKLERGELPGMAPVGYLNDIATKKVINDPERYALIREAWRLLLTGNYSVAMILRRLNDRLGFRTVRRNRSGGKPLALSALYRVFANPFYAGIIRVRGQEFPGAHDPMISVGEFERAQNIVKRRDRQRPSKHVFTYSKLFKCGECEAFITAEHRIKRLRSVDKTRSYTYYHCTRRKIGPACSQRNCLTEQDLTLGIERALAKYSLRPEFRDFALRHLQESTHQKAEERRREIERLQREIDEARNQTANLTRMRYRDFIGDDDFLRENESLQRQITRCHMRLEQLSTVEERSSRIERAFVELTSLSERFHAASVEERRNILTWVSSNRTIRDGNVSIQPTEWLQPIADFYLPLAPESTPFEPPGGSIVDAKKDADASVILRWQAVVDEVYNRFPFEDNKAS